MELVSIVIWFPSSYPNGLVADYDFQKYYASALKERPDSRLDWGDSIQIGSVMELLTRDQWLPRAITARTAL
jgi:hypothetical protein